MTVCALVIGDDSPPLWGLPSMTRIERQLHAVGITTVARAAAATAGFDAVMIVNQAFLFEVRTFRAMLNHKNTLLRCPLNNAVAAAFVPISALDDYLAVVAQRTHDLPPDAHALTPNEIEGYDEDLRKFEAPLLEPVDADNRQALESKLYGNSYKGITDLVTKWWWPRPARVVVGWCARAHVAPNWVTLAGLLLVILACFLFLQGHYLSGLLAGWFMTFLDTVDGKLARVTVSSSRVGHILDHGMDIIHPPFWYVFWGYGLAAETMLADQAVEHIALVIVVGYIAGRAIEALFHALGACSMFAWRPFDAYFRLITARRNPCLIILTVATLCGRPDLGFLGVAGWTAISSTLMALRLLYASFVRLQKGPLQSWLKDPENAARQFPRAYVTFAATRSAYA